MNVSRSFRRALPASIATLSALAPTLGCDIQMRPAGANSVSSEARAAKENCNLRFAASDREACRRDQAEDEAARADWAEKQRQFDAAFADEIAAFHAIEPGLKNTDTATAALANQADDLRLRFVKRCIAESGWSTTACWNGTFARDITAALAKIRRGQGDEVAAAAEAFTLHEKQDLRSTDAKIWKAHGLVCGRDMFAGRACPYTPEAQPVGTLEDMKRAADAKMRNEVPPVEWRSGSEIQSMAKTQAGAVFTFKAERATASEGRSCGDPEWRADAAGNQVLVRPCQTERFVTDAKVYAPALVPLADIGDYKASAGWGAVVVYSTKGRHEGHVLQTWREIDKVADGGVKTVHFVMFRGTRVEDAKPGYP